MKTKLIAALIASLGLAASASAATTTGTLESASTSSQAFIDFSSTGTFSFDLIVTPTLDNTLKLTFAAPLVGSFSNLSYSLYDGSTFLASYTIASNGKATAFNDATPYFSSTSLLANHAYTLTLAGTVSSLNASQLAVYKVTTTNGSIAAVPEPESYAMLLAGLGLVGTIARRRRAKQA
jgi:hypothetical protein